MSAKITLDTSDYEKSLDDAGKKTSIFADLVKANLTSDAIKAGVKKLASAIVDVGKVSLDAYAENEQLVGGVETLFKKSSSVVQNYAKNAYKTAGLSANEYMSTVTSFSASLLQSLENDTAAAAEYADMAITDMSDNANKMGTSMESIQNAYQGFAKQNYTMLDNLKLGYGGTKTEMARLLEDAENIKAANGEMVEYSIDSFADMVEAIHVVQDNMGITGTTALEASTTIEGSVNSMKAAWENLATGMADEEADMEELTKNFVDSVGTAANNIAPRVKQIVNGFAEAADDTISYIRITNKAFDTIIEVLEDVAVAALAAGGALLLVKVGGNISTGVGKIKGIATALSELSTELGEAAIQKAALDGTLSGSTIAVGLLTGKVKLATVAQKAWNSTMSTAASAVVWMTAVVVSTKKAYEAGKEYMDQLTETDGTIEGVQARYNELCIQLAELEDLEEDLGYLEGDDFERKVSLEIAIAQLSEEYEELSKQEAKASEEAAELAAQEAMVEAAVNQISTAADTYIANSESVLQDFYDVYDSIYGKLYDASTMFTDVATAMTISYDDMMANLQKNTEFNNRYTDSLNYVLSAAENAGINIDGLTDALSEMDASKAAGVLEAVRGQLEGASDNAEDAAKILSEVSDNIAAYAESAANGSIAMAETIVDVEGQLTDAFNQYAESIEGLDNYAELYEAGKNNLSGLLLGIREKTPELLSELDDMTEKMKSALQTNFDDFTLTVNAVVRTVKESVDGSHASGLSYVPFDGYIAELHRGETVLTAEEAAAYRSGNRITSESVTNGNQLDHVLQYLDELLESSRENTALMAEDRTLQVGEREFGRLVKQFA